MLLWEGFDDEVIIDNDGDVLFPPYLWISDAKTLRKLSKWLHRAADYLESTKRTGKRGTSKK